MFSVNGTARGVPSVVLAALATQIASEKTRVPQAAGALDGIQNDVTAALSGVSDTFTTDDESVVHPERVVWQDRVVDITFNLTLHIPGIVS